MRVLGVDCGTQVTGYGVIDSDGRHHSLVEAGAIRLGPRDELGKRLATIAAELRAVIARTHPGEASVEAVFHAVNARSAIVLAHARGATLLVLQEAGLTVGEYSPLAVKSAVTGYGRAGKPQVRRMIESLLGTVVTESALDASDALAVALCHETRRHSLISRGAR